MGDINLIIKYLEQLGYTVTKKIVKEVPVNQQPQKKAFTFHTMKK